MAKLIELADIIVNVDRIAWVGEQFQETYPPTRSRIWFSGCENDYVSVAETPEQIFALINDMRGAA